MAKKDPIPTSILMDICELFLKEKVKEKRTADYIASWVRTYRGHDLRRTEVWDAIREAVDRGLIRFTPAKDWVLSDKLSKHYKGRIQVVSTGKANPSQVLAVGAAQLIMKRIRLIGKDRAGGSVHIGFAGGIATREVARELASLYNATADAPELTVHAVTSGVQPDKAELAPLAFFSWFSGTHKVRFQGLFAPPFVESADRLESLKRIFGVVQSFEAADEIDVVVTSLGDASHAAGRWLPFVPDDQKDAFVAKGWVGDVCYCPFSATGPIHDTVLHPVTLFSIPDFVQLAKSPGRYVFLLCGPSRAAGGALKTKALKPLLEIPELRVWTDLVIDEDTAREVAAGLPKTVGASRRGEEQTGTRRRLPVDPAVIP